MEFEKKVLELDVNDVLPNRFQPRIKFNEDSINELCESIKEHGVIQPIVVRAMGDKYEIIAGERRYKASLLAGKQTIPAVITELNDKDSAEVALIENVQRKDLTPIEEAISYKKILDMGYLTQEELAKKLGKTQSTVANKLRLLNLDEEVQEAVLEEKISERHARSLLKLSNMQDQRKMLDQIIENRLTVRKTDENINQLLNGKDDEDTSESDSEKVLEPTYFEEEKTLENPLKVSPISSQKFPTFDLTNIVESNSFNDEPIIIIDDPEQLPVINEDQVTVNPTEEFNPFNLDNNSINQDITLSQDNIPNNPIEEVQSLDINDNNIQEDTIYTSTELNPGFMNISEIESNAKDINTSKEKEEIDINSLLKPSVIGQEISVATEIPVELPSEELRAGKFFTLPMEEEENAENKEETVEMNVTQGMPDAFNFDLNVGKEDNITDNELNNQFNFNISEDIPIESSIIDEYPSKNTNELNVPLNSNKVEETSNDMQATKDEKNNSSAETLSNESILPFIEEEEWTNNLINPDFDFNISAPVEREDFVTNEPLSLEEMTVSNLVSPVELNKSLSDAIEIIRSNTKQLEKMGFIVDTEEFDFETAYQIIIKIEK